MPRKTKKFIDKKNAVTFVLGHRSQQDPLIADETAPQRVLIPLHQTQGPCSSSDRPGGTGTSVKSGKVDVVKKKEEEQKFGIYFDDDYDYLQHLKDSKEISNMEWDICDRIYAADVKPKEVIKKSEMKDFKLNLPSSVFGSEFQEEIGMLNKAAPSHGPRPDLDPDVVAGLDDDYNFEEQEDELEDNFMELANQGENGDGEPSAEDIEGLFSDDDSDYEDMDDEGDDEDADTVGSLKGPQYSFDDEETKSRFTNYSMSSSVVHRNKQLLLVDDRFEKMFEGYEDTEIGALDCDDIEGDIDPHSALLLKYADEFEKDQIKENGLNEKIARIALKEEESSSDDIMSDDEEVQKDKWDCESILSTYSTTKNRPKLIREPSKRDKIKISDRTGLPLGVLGKGLTQGNLKELNRRNADEEEIDSSRHNKSVLTGISSVRGKNETTQERKERKMIVKEYRKERRMERKANSAAFTDEKKRQEKVRLNIKANLQGLKL